jgi:hypothetical protein
MTHRSTRTLRQRNKNTVRTDQVTRQLTAQAAAQATGVHLYTCSTNVTGSTTHLLHGCCAQSPCGWGAAAGWERAMAWRQHQPGVGPPARGKKGTHTSIKPSSTSYTIKQARSLQPQARRKPPNRRGSIRVNKCAPKEVQTIHHQPPHHPTPTPYSCHTRAFAHQVSGCLSELRCVNLGEQLLPLQSSSNLLLSGSEGRGEGQAAGANQGGASSVLHPQTPVNINTHTTGKGQRGHRISAKLTSRMAG